MLSKLAKIKGLGSIRIMYAYINGITDELIDEMAKNPKVLHYLDIPVQHGDDEILKKMRRKDTVKSITDTLAKLRKAIPDIVIRSTVMVGFPGEKAEHFDLTLDVRGKRAEEALDMVAKYLDEAKLLSIKEVSILHGKGNGILRKLIREYLSRDHDVKQFADASLETGGTGITRVRLN